MGFYENRVVPFMIDLACGTKPIGKQREKVVPLAEGRVLEVGMGVGHNIPYYDATRVEFVWGLEPCEGMRRRAEPNLAKAPFEVKWLDLPGEEIPLDDHDADTVLLTYTLCSIADFRKALAGMRRVLKPGGKLVFCEHGRASDESVRVWQDRLNPLWKLVTGGCNINRPVIDCLEEAGFAIRSSDAMYLPGTPRVAGFNTWGVAVPR